MVTFLSLYFQLIMNISKFNSMGLEQKALECPVCKSNKAMMVGENVKLSGRFEDKEFLTTELTVLRCTKCGYYMLFDKMAQFSTKE